MFCTLVLVTTVAVCRSESTTEWMKSKFSDLSDSAQDMATSVTESVKQAASSMSEYALGPDRKETEFCIEHSCDIPGSNMPKREADSSEINEDGGELNIQEPSPPQKWDVISTIQNTVTDAWDSVQYTMYKRAEEFTESIYNTTAEYAEKVRYVFREEFSNFLAYFLWESSAVTTPASGKNIAHCIRVAMILDNSSPAITSHIADSLYQRLQKAVWHRFLIIGLIIICLLFSYIFWHLYLGILFILAFNCTMLILYKVLGPELVYWLFWKGVVYVRYCLSYVISHPYISAAVIVVIFSWSIYWTLKRWYIEYSRVEREERMETAIVSINTRLQKIEEQQEEMLHLLRKLQSAN